MYQTGYNSCYGNVVIKKNITTLKYCVQFRERYYWKDVAVKSASAIY